MAQKKGTGNKKLQAKAIVAKILGSWDTAQKRGTKRKDREADEAANDTP